MSAAIRIDGDVPVERPLRHIWVECVGAGRANEALRADWQEHFRKVVSVLGARYVRFHDDRHDVDRGQALGISADSVWNSVNA